MPRGKKPPKERLDDLSQAIDHAKSIGQHRGACGKEHRQLAAWLEELALYRRVSAPIRELEDEGSTALDRLSQFYAEDDVAGIDKAVRTFLSAAWVDRSAPVQDDSRAWVGWWLRELKLRREQMNTERLFVAFRFAAQGDREGFDKMLETFPEQDRMLVRGLAEQTVFEELRQRSLPKRDFPFATWHTEIRVILEKLFGMVEGGETDAGKAADTTT
jgi:hypothetical protein